MNTHKFPSSVSSWDPHSSVETFTRSLIQSNYFATVKRKVRYLPPSSNHRTNITKDPPRATSTSINNTIEPVQHNTVTNVISKKKPVTVSVPKNTSYTLPNDRRIRYTFKKKADSLQTYIRQADNEFRHRRTLRLLHQRYERVQYERQDRLFRHNLYKAQLRNECMERQRTAGSYREFMNQIIEADAIENIVTILVESASHFRSRHRSVEKEFI